MSDTLEEMLARNLDAAAA